MPYHFRRPTLIISRTNIAVSAAGALGLVALAAAAPQFVGHPVGSALDALAGAQRSWLFLAAVGFVASFGCTVAAWRAALAAAGGRICPRQAAARLGIGAMVNSFAPAKLGDAVKIALFSRAIDAPGRIWTMGGVYAALGAARSLGLAALVVVASATGAMPLWPVFALCGVVAVFALAAVFSSRLRRQGHVAQLLDGFAALQRSPRALATVVGWTFAMVAFQLAAAMAIAAALGIPHPVAAALVILPALDVASALPLTPGSIGIGSGAVAVALASRGIGTADALGVGFAIQGLQTLVSIAAGSVGAVYLMHPGSTVRRWALRAATVGGSAAFATALGAVVVFDLF